MAATHHVHHRIKRLNGDEEQATIHMGVLERWNLVDDVVGTNKVSYNQLLPPGVVLVSPANRGGLGVNPYNVHKTGKTIYKVGPDMSLLLKPTAW